MRTSMKESRHLQLPRSSMLTNGDVQTAGKCTYVLKAQDALFLLACLFFLFFSGNNSFRSLLITFLMTCWVRAWVLGK